MALDITTLRQAAEGAMYVAPQRICVTADGRLTSEDDPEAVRLLVGKGGSLPAAEAAAYGLIAGDVSSDAGTEGAGGGEDAAPVAPRKRRTK